MAVNDFNRIAPYYDRISRLIFGDELLKAQTYFLNEIKLDEKILLLGGGTGELLKYLPVRQKIHFVEMSERMIRHASKRKVKAEVKFVNKDFLKFNSSKYDLIICPFFLDCFNEKHIKIVLTKIKSMLEPNGHLLVTDFQKTKSNVLTLKIMHLFFKVLVNLEARFLLDIHKKVLSAGFHIEKEKISHRNQLFSRLYRNL